MSPKAKIALIFAICLAPIVFGSAAYFLHWGTGSGNYGELLEPRMLDAAAFRALRGKWVLVTFDPATCSAQCERKLYMVRQVRRALGGEAERIERLWIVNDGGTPAADILAAIAGTHVAPLSDAGPPQAFPSGDRRAYIYLVDPLGNLMMRFPHDADPARMIKDLARLLKVSRTG